MNDDVSMNSNLVVGGDLSVNGFFHAKYPDYSIPPSHSITVEFLDSFNAQKKAIEKCVDAVTLATKHTLSLSDQVKSAINPDDIDKISKSLADVVKNAQRDAAKGKQLLDALKKDGEVLMKTNPRSDRIQPYKAQYMRLCKLYVDAMKEHQKAKEGLRKVQTDDLVRRGMILYGDTKSESEIRAKVEQDPANFVREAIMEEAADEAQAAYAEAQSRARDVEFLVRSLGEVRRGREATGAARRRAAARGGVCRGARLTSGALSPPPPPPPGRGHVSGPRGPRAAPVGDA